MKVSLLVTKDDIPNTDGCEMTSFLCNSRKLFAALFFTCHLLPFFLSPAAHFLGKPDNISDLVAAFLCYCSISYSG
jgi:hypothetical protein